MGRKLATRGAPGQDYQTGHYYIHRRVIRRVGYLHRTHRPTTHNPRGGGGCRGRWKPEDRGFHINVLELKAIHHGLKSLIPTHMSQVKILTDNMTALSYIKNMGGVRSVKCNAEAKKIWQYCERHNMWLIPAHIPGKLNIQADTASRQFSDDIEWELSHKIWEKIIKNWGRPTCLPRV